MIKFNSRERVLASINHKEPDKVPIDLGGTTVTGISVYAYAKLKEYLGMDPGKIRVYDVTQQLAWVEKEITQKFSTDVLDSGRVYKLNEEDWYDINIKGIDLQFPYWFKPIKNDADGSYEYYNREGLLLGRMPKASFFFDQTYYPYLDGYPEDFSDFNKDMKNLFWLACPNPPFDSMDRKRFWRDFKQRAKELQEKSNKALTLTMGGSTFEFGTVIRRIDNFLMDLIRNKSKVEKLVDKLLDFAIATATFVCQYLDGIVDIVRIGDDLGSNVGPFMRPETYREIFKPRTTELCKYIKKHSSMKIFFHSCGSVYELIPDLIDAGIDILNPVQLNVKDMDPKRLKEEFGDELTFWGGGADTKNVLSRKSPEEVKKHVRELLEIFSPGGGFIWSAVHNITAEVPPENIVAAIETVHKFNSE
ncbi:MAG: methyltransferase [Promethearchaeota archaeon]|nr:MAG: methyltransferase [Candidatus Lokiarchaeota archaeon]